MSDNAGDPDSYALKSGDLREVEAPRIAYLPPMPKHYCPRIGVIGTGGISNSHLEAYRTAGWDVKAIWNRTRSKAEAKTAEFFPTAHVADAWQDLLADSEIDVVDITLHPEHRAPMIEAALRSGKHVLSQKPFVTNLDLGEDLVKLADDQGLKLAVNQNGRWAPHMAYMRETFREGWIGNLLSIHASIHWNHGWTSGTTFDDIEDLVLFDFGLHWFDFVVSLAGGQATSVFAMSGKALGQTNKVPLLAQALIRMESAQASLVFDGGVPYGARDTTFVSGTKGTIRSEGPDLGDQSLTLTMGDTVARPELDGQWFNDGFRGAMGELLCAIEDDREPENSARGNLESLALAFAAVQSRATGRETAVGKARSLYQ